MKVLTCGSCETQREDLRKALAEALALFEAIRAVSVGKNVREACEAGIGICKRHEKGNTK